MKMVDKMVLQKNEILGTLENREIEVIVTMGAGDIDQLVDPIEKMLINRL